MESRKALLAMVVAIAIVVIITALVVLTPRKPQIRTYKIGLVQVPASAQRIIVKSVFSNGSTIPTTYTCRGLNTSIPLELSNVPSNAKSLVVIMEDLNAPGGVFIHWVLYDIPPNVTSIPSGLPGQYYVAGFGYQGINDFGSIGYGGPCPPPGPPHEYVIVVLALNTSLTPRPGASDRDIVSALSVNYVVGYGVLVGYYG